MKQNDETASGLFIGSEPIDGIVHERSAMSDGDSKDGGHGPKDGGDSDGTDKGDADGTDKGDSDGSDKGDGGANSRDADGKD